MIESGEAEQNKDPFAGLNHRLVPEAAFDEAFARIEAMDRAWIKKNISQLHTMYATGGSEFLKVERQWSQGFWTRESLAPLDRVAICFPGSFLSSPRLLAAVLPPLAADIKQCCAIRVGAEDDSWDSRLLGGLELAGVEEVYDASGEDFEAWMQSLMRESAMRAVFLDGLEPPRQYGPGSGGTVYLPAVHRLGVWFQNAEQWDLQAIRAAHPGVRLLLGGPAAPCGDSEREEAVDAVPAEFFALDLDALFVPTFLFQEATAFCRRVFGPGQEGCWIWPELSLDPFLRRTVCVSQAG